MSSAAGSIESMVGDAVVLERQAGRVNTITTHRAGIRGPHVTAILSDVRQRMASETNRSRQSRRHHESPSKSLLVFSF